MLKIYIIETLSTSDSYNDYESEKYYGRFSNDIQGAAGTHKKTSEPFPDKGKA